MRLIGQGVFWLLFLIFMGGLWAVSETAVADQEDSIRPEYPQVFQTFPMPNTNYHPLFLRPKAA